MQQRILVTGGAGFVGMHTTMRLLKLGHYVIVFDSMNSYYSTDLKHKRVDKMRTAGAIIVHGNVCDGGLLSEILRTYRIDRVIHLAAQAGVRYSLEAPLEYVESNVKCFVVLCEALARLNMTSNHMVYASSSSVYGLNTKFPFAESDTVINPASLYAVTKASDELIARAYFNLHQVKSIGLRFFTVYGPWGRPDMAYYSFVHSIMNNISIPVYNNGQSMRDFTFIDDVVDGIISSLFIEIASSEIINIGNNKGVKLMDFVTIIERNVGKSAHIEYKAMAKGDVPLTYANIEKAKCMLAYNPITTIEEGISKFVKWFVAENGSSYMYLKNISKKPNKWHQPKEPFLPSILQSMSKDEQIVILQKSDKDGINKTFTHEFCLVTSIFSPLGRPSLDRPVNIKEFSSKNPGARFFLYTNHVDIVAPGWEVVIKHFEYRRFITHSRWPKFQAWKDAQIQACQAVFYIDGFLHPAASGDVFRSMAKQIRASDKGLAQDLHLQDNGGGPEEEVCFPANFLLL
jgi:UDP-glucuronate 4-epimerase